jgi:hypothetical protein
VKRRAGYTDAGPPKSPSHRRNTSPGEKSLLSSENGARCAAVRARDIRITRKEPLACE